MALWLLTRPEVDSARTLEALAAAGHRAVVAPVIAIDTGAPDPVDLDGVQAILFTSANGVRAFARLSPRRDLPVLAVGAASSAEARQAGFSRVTSADGDAVALADLAARTCDPTGGALFHAAGKDTAGDLAARLGAAGFDVRRRVLYRAGPVDRLPEVAARTLDDPALAGTLFFSPRTAKTFVRLVREAGKQDRLARLAAVCLSPAVAGRLDRDAWGEVRIAERPDMDALVAQLDPPPVPSVTIDSARMASRDEKTNETKPESAPGGAPKDETAPGDATGTPQEAPIGAPSAEPEAGAAADV
ncbi:MAG: hypothetical protein GVY28_03475, partial [Alphaproteobacteria bacterium]|nr:hypothetical protein [Alphaproteobacteria bacterium]